MSHFLAHTRRTPVAYQQVEQAGSLTITPNEKHAQAMISRNGASIEGKETQFGRHACIPSSADSSWTWEVLGALLCVLSLVGVSVCCILLV
jgi:hypothetical protein